MGMIFPERYTEISCEHCDAILGWQSDDLVIDGPMACANHHCFSKRFSDHKVCLNDA